LFCIEDRHGWATVQSPPAIETMPGGSTLEVFQSAGADSLARATGLTLLEQDFESALAAIPSGYGRRRVRGAAVRRHGAEVSRRKADQPVRASARGRRRRQLQPSLGGLKSDISRGPRSAKSRLMHLQPKHGRSKWNIFKQRAEPRCENSICIRNLSRKKCLHSWFFNLSFFMGHNCLWRSHEYSLGSASTGAGRFAERAPDSPPQP